MSEKAQVKSGENSTKFTITFMVTDVPISTSTVVQGSNSVYTSISEDAKNPDAKCGPPYIA